MLDAKTFKNAATTGVGVVLENKSALMTGGGFFVLGVLAWKAFSFLMAKKARKVSPTQALTQLSMNFFISPYEDETRQSLDDFLENIEDYAGVLAKQLLDSGETIAITQDVTLNESLAAPEYGVYIGDGVFEAIRQGEFPEKGLLKGVTYNQSAAEKNLFRFCRIRIDTNSFYQGTSVKTDDGDTDFHVIDNPPETYFDLPSFIDDAGEGYVYSVAPYLNNGLYTIFVTRLDAALEKVEQKALQALAS